jgi:hypothetical protein
MLPVVPVAILIACLLDPVLWTLALCGVLLGRKLAWPPWVTVLASAILAMLGSLLVLGIVDGDHEFGYFSLGVRLTASLIAAGVVLLILRVFDRRKTT